MKELLNCTKLLPSENKVIYALSKILCQNSKSDHNQIDNFFPEKKDLAMRSLSKSIESTPTYTSLYNITQEYQATENVTNEEIIIVKNILGELCSKKFLLTYTETRRTEKGRIKRIIEEYSPLIRMVKLTRTYYNQVDLDLSMKEEIIVFLNPIFRKQIESNSINWTNNLSN